jgi:hypothetical protein
MNLQKTISLFIASFAWLFTGCVDEDLSDCDIPTGADVILYFDYPDNAPATFPDRISRVNIGIYGDDGILVESKQIEKESLDSLQGVRFNLPYGDYTAICWGNAYAKTRIEGFSPKAPMNDEKIYHPDIFKKLVTAIAADDSLFYGKLSTFHVPSDQLTPDIIHFVPAHINFEISALRLKNLTLPSLTDDVIPFIRLNNLNEVYDADMNDINPDRVSFYPTGMIDTINDLLLTRTTVHRLANDSQVSIDLVENRTSDKILKTIQLSQFLIENPQYAIIPGKERTIYLTFYIGNDADITINPNPRNKIPVIPDK